MINVIAQKVPIRTVVCTDCAGGIGSKDGTIPWHNEKNDLVKTDLKAFKYLTYRSICVVGRETYETMKEIPSVKSGRFFFVLTSDPKNFVGEYTNAKPFNGNVFDAIESVYETFFIQSDQIYFEGGISIIGGKSVYDPIFNPMNRFLTKNIDIYRGWLSNDYDCDVKFSLNQVAEMHDRNEERLIHERQGEDEYMLLKYSY